MLVFPRFWTKLGVIGLSGLASRAGAGTLAGASSFWACGTAVHEIAAPPATAIASWTHFVIVDVLPVQESPKVASVLEKGNTALITGASSGIGEAFARALARRGMHLVLVARGIEKLESLAATLREQTDVTVMAADLTQPAAADRLLERVNVVDLLVNNAGMGLHGRFLDIDAARQRAQRTLNVDAVMDLTLAYLPGMVARRHGAIIHVASTAALQPVPYMAVYGATKAFVLSFSEALSVEFAGSGVTIQALLPGNTETPFHSKVGEQDGRVGPARTPDQVVASSLRGLERGRPVVIDGVSNQMLAVLPRLLPRSWAARVTGNLMRKGL
jgi:hypothetical protein